MANEKIKIIVEGLMFKQYLTVKKGFTIKDLKRLFKNQIIPEIQKKKQMSTFSPFGKYGILNCDEENIEKLDIFIKARNVDIPKCYLFDNDEIKNFDCILCLSSCNVHPDQINEWNKSKTLKKN